MSLDLDYFYGNEAEQFSFYRIPKTLFTEPRFSSVSMEAKILYGLMLDRMGLSVRNGWLDNAGRVYIYFTLEDALSMLGCGKDKAVRLFKELDLCGGIGLIERHKQGQGKPTLIYLKRFTPSPPDHPNPSPPADGMQTSEKPKSGLPGSTDALTSEKPKSRLRCGRTQDFGKTASNNTEYNHTELNDTDLSILPPSPSARGRPVVFRSKRRMRIDEMDSYRELIKENIDFDLLLQEHPYDADVLEGYVELMVEVCCSHKDFIRIAGEDIPTGVVKNRFLKLDKFHIAYVLECMNNNTSLIRNIKSYTLSALYNAPITMGQYYASQVSHDMAQGFYD